jgi:hypothetical protein
MSFVSAPAYEWVVKILSIGYASVINVAGEPMCLHIIYRTVLYLDREVQRDPSPVDPIRCLRHSLVEEWVTRSMESNKCNVKDEIFRPLSEIIRRYSQHYKEIFCLKHYSNPDRNTRHANNRS